MVKVADDGTPNGTLYVNYSDGTNIFLKSSTDKGDTWSAPIQINNGPEVTKNLFPWIETGSVPGSVGIVWYGTASEINNTTRMECLLRAGNQRATGKSNRAQKRRRDQFTTLRTSPGRDQPDGEALTAISSTTSKGRLIQPARP